MNNTEFREEYLAIMKDPNRTFKASGLEEKDRKSWEQLKKEIKEATTDRRIVEIPSDFEDLTGFRASDHYEKR